MVNAFRWLGDYLHLLAVAVLFANIWRTKNCVGISAKSQFLYALVFTTRYLDVNNSYISIGGWALRTCYALFTYCTLFSMTLFFWKTYEKKYDTARVGILIIPCIVIAMLINFEFTFLEICWAFSEYLEAVAMIPQFHMIIETKRIHKYVVGYIAAIGIYRGLYIANWAYRYYDEDRFDKISLAAGMIQFILYCDFFLQIWPWLITCKNDEQSSTSDIEVLVDSEVPKTGHLASNVSTIVLTPDSLTGFHDDKGKPLTTKKAAEK